MITAAAIALAFGYLFTWWAVIWILAAVLTGAAGYARGRSFFGWLLLGFVMPVITLLALIAFPVLSPPGWGRLADKIALALLALWVATAVIVLPTSQPQLVAVREVAASTVTQPGAVELVSTPVPTAAAMVVVKEVPTVSPEWERAFPWFEAIPVPRPHPRKTAGTGRGN